MITLSVSSGAVLGSAEFFDGRKMGLIRVSAAFLFLSAFFFSNRLLFCWSFFLNCWCFFFGSRLFGGLFFSWLFCGSARNQ